MFKPERLPQRRLLVLLFDFKITFQEQRNYFVDEKNFHDLKILDKNRLGKLLKKSSYFSRFNEEITFLAASRALEVNTRRCSFHRRIGTILRTCPLLF